MTHILTKSFSVPKEGGGRVTLQPGEPFTPNQIQLRNMPDVFVAVDGSAATEVPTGLPFRKSDAVGRIKEGIGAVEDLDVLDALIAQEENGRNRGTAIEAIQDRIDALTADEVG